MLAAARPAAAALILLLLVPMIASACGGGEEPPAPKPADGRYENRRMRYEFAYPTSWEDITGKVRLVAPAEAQVLDHVAVGSYEDDTGMMNGAQVSVVRISHDISQAELEAALTDLDEAFQKQAAAVRGKLRDPEWVELGGLKARQYIIEFVFGANQAASAQTITFFGDRQYTVNCQGRFETFDDKVLPGCEQVLQSFRFQ